MSKKGAKKQIEDNRKRLRLLQIILAIANSIQISVRFGLRRRTLTAGDYVMLGLTSIIYTATYSGVSLAAKPTYGENGELIDGGSDLNMGGVLSIYHDLLYLTAAAQLLSVFSTRWWYLLLLAPAFGLYQLWIHVLYPFMFPPPEVVYKETDAERKKREKVERRQNRAHIRR